MEKDKETLIQEIIEETAKEIAKVSPEAAILLLAICQSAKDSDTYCNLATARGKQMLMACAIISKVARTNNDKEIFKTVLDNVEESKNCRYDKQ